MADHESAKLDRENHLLLDQSLLRLPHELLRKNFRAAHLAIEKDKEPITKLIKEATIKGLHGGATKEDVLASLDTIIARGKKLRSKLGACQAEEARLFQQTDTRIKHLAELQDLHTLEDVKYETWSHARLDRLLVDYLLRQGYSDTASALAAGKDMTDLVDIDTFVTMSRIQTSLRKNKSVTEALAWCMENKKELRKINSNLEFALRYQQYIELIRLQTCESLLQAIAHAKKFLYPYKSTYPDEFIQAAGLLAFSPAHPGAKRYSDLFSPARWDSLADLFVRTHNELLSLPSIPLLHVALSSGLSALKTPACHSSTASQAGVSSNKTLPPRPGPRHRDSDDDEEDDVDMDMPTAASTARGDGNKGGAKSRIFPSADPPFSSNGRMCPICSAELNDLARNVPYAHHNKSHVDHDLRLLPNYRVYGLERLREHARKQGLEPGWVKDLRGPGTWREDELKKVYIT